MRRTTYQHLSARTILGAGLAAALLVGSLALGGCGASGGSDDAADEPTAEEQADDAGSDERDAEEPEEREPERTPEEAAEGYVQAVFDVDGPGMWELLPPDVRDAALDEAGMSEDEAIEELEGEMESALGSSLEGAEGIVDGFTVEATDSSDLSSSEIDELIDTYESEYDLALDIEDAAEVDLDITMELTPEGADAAEESGVTDSDLTQSLTVVAIQVDGEWYFDMTCLV